MSASSQEAFIKGRRPPFFQFAWRLYRTHDGFSGLVDFAVIGSIVVMFIQPPSFEWAHRLAQNAWHGIESSFGLQKPRTDTPHQTPASTQKTPATPVAGPASATPTAPADTPANPAAAATSEPRPAEPVPSQPVMPAPSEQRPGAVAPGEQKSATATPDQQKAATAPAPPPFVHVPMPAANEVKGPRLLPFYLIDIDVDAFKSSKPEDRERLLKAALSYRSMRNAEIMDDLTGAIGSDPNVLFMRALSVIFQTDPGRFRIARELLQWSANGGNRQASLMLGVFLAAGAPGIDKDVEKGKQLIEAAAEKGDRTALRAAGIGHNNGQFAILDPVKGVAFIKRAADAGDTPAMVYYAYLLSAGAGTEKNETLAEDYLRRAAEAGLTGAQETLGAWLLDRYKAGMSADPTEGLQWLKRAYEAGQSIYAVFRLALFYAEDARGAWKDTRKSFALLSLCEGFSYMPCQFAYANHLQHGQGTEKDYVKAYARFEVARGLGSTNAVKRIETLTPQMVAGEKDAAIDLAKTIRRELRRIPDKTLFQHPDMLPRPSPWPAGAPSLP